MLSSHQKGVCKIVVRRKRMKAINCIQTILNDVAISFLLWPYIFQLKQVWSDTLKKKLVGERGMGKNVKRGKSYEAKGCDIIIICAWFMLTFIAALFDIFSSLLLISFSFFPFQFLSFGLRLIVLACMPQHTQKIHIHITVYVCTLLRHYLFSNTYTIYIQSIHLYVCNIEHAHSMNAKWKKRTHKQT